MDFGGLSFGDKAETHECDDDDDDADESADFHCAFLLCLLFFTTLTGPDKIGSKKRRKCGCLSKCNSCFR